MGNAVGCKLHRVLPVLFLALASSCGMKEDSKSFQGIACGASDQHLSYMNPMDSTAIQTISVDSNFTADEKSAIEEMVAEWNSESRRSIGRDLFRTVELSLSAASVPDAARECGFPGTAHAFSIVRVTSKETWSSLGFTEANPGVTIRCSAGQKFTEKQVVLINPNTVSLAQNPKIFKSVVIHELGHAIGLDHSCDPSNAGNPGFAACAPIKYDMDHDYRQAVMYPIVETGRLKEYPRPNDQERATCALNYRP